MPVRSYSGAAKSTSLTGAVTAAATIINVADATGWPTGASGPFIVTIDAGVTTEEKVLVSGRTGNSFTVSVRGFDDTTASDHGNAATVQHTISAADLREANAHVNDTTGDPHPQYLTATEGAALYPPLSHTHNYADPAHSHTYDSITLKPAVVPPVVPLLGISPAIEATWTGVANPLTGASVTFAAPASGNVLVRASGYITASGQSTVTLTIGGTQVLEQTVAAGSWAVNGVAVMTGLTPGASTTYQTTAQITGVQGTWKGRIEVWTAP